MLFFIGAMLILAGIWMIIRLYIHSKRPRVEDAQIIDCAREYFEIKGHVTPRKVPVGRIEYFYRSVKYKAEIMLKSKSLKAGDRIQLSVNPDKPTDVEHYYATREFLAALTVLFIGTAIIIACLIWMDKITL
jgi:hypothetical protein